MRHLVLLIFTLSGSLFPAEPYPHWDGKESVDDYARKVNLPPTQSLDLGNGVKLDLVLIPAGTFIMGTPEPESPIVGRTMVGISVAALIVLMVFILIRARRKQTRLQFSMALMLLLTLVASIGVWGGVRWHQALNHPFVNPDQHPAHSVTLTQPYYMGKYEVTQEQYQSVIGLNPSEFVGQDSPVEKVSWDDAQAFCEKLSRHAKQAVRLPTEAEWEYACRAGTTTTFHSGDTESDLDRVAWYDAKMTHPVGQKDANAFGLYDMHGNIWEWCADWYALYPAGPINDPTGAISGSSRILRGGAWFYNSVFARSGDRGSLVPDYRSRFIGFRVVMQIPPKNP